MATDAAPLKRRMKWWKRLLRGAAIGYAIAGIMLYAFQTKLIFQGAWTKGDAGSVAEAPVNGELLALRTPEGTKIAAIFARANAPADTKKAPTILFFYGNAMCMRDACDLLNDFRRLGANVMVVEYEGYGMSEGRPSEEGCYRAAEAGYQYLVSRAEIDRGRIVVAGWSLGAAVAIDLAHRHRDEGNIRGVMAFSAFTSMPAMAGHHYPIFPTSFLLQHRFESQKKLAEMRLPILIVHGAKDDIVPVWMADQLAETAKAAGAPVTRFVHPAAGHNDFFAVAEEEIGEEMGKFLGTLGVLAN